MFASTPAAHYWNYDEVLGSLGSAQAERYLCFCAWQHAWENRPNKNKVSLPDFELEAEAEALLQTGWKPKD